MSDPSYLEPYLNAARRFGGGFQSLLWASPRTQAARFEALARLCKVNGRSMIDAGCGRADLLDYLLARGIEPSSYIGLEAVDALADAADAKRHAMARIVRGDFIRDPQLFDARADAIVFSGSLNTLSTTEFYATLHQAWNATGRDLAFNFLSSAMLAAGKHLTWYRQADVVQFVGKLSNDFYVLDDYLDGDCTVLVRKAV